jgi:hypothetical protein
MELMAPPEHADQGKIPETFEVFNDPEKRGKAKRALGINARSTEGPLTGGLSREAYNEFLNDTTTGGFARRRLSRRDDDGEDIKEMTISKSAFNIRNADEYELGPRLSSGEYTYSSEEGTTFSVTTSASIGAAENIFTASVGIDASQEDSWGISEEVKFEVDCKNQGQVTFYPYYNY